MFGLETTRVSTEAVPTVTLAGAKLLATAGGTGTTRVALALLPAPPLLDSTAELTLL